MTDKKISELGTITQGDIASGDWVAVVDSSENATKKYNFGDTKTDVTAFFNSTDTDTAGTIVRTRAEGFAYRAVDTATASTVANAGGQAFEVLPGEDGFVTLEQLGAAGDGVTDDRAVFLKAVGRKVRGSAGSTYFLDLNSYTDSVKITENTFWEFPEDCYIRWGGFGMPLFYFPQDESGSVINGAKIIYDGTAQETLPFTQPELQTFFDNGPGIPAPGYMANFLVFGSKYIEINNSRTFAKTPGAGKSIYAHLRLAPKKDGSRGGFFKADNVTVDDVVFGFLGSGFDTTRLTGHFYGGRYDDYSGGVYGWGALGHLIYHAGLAGSSNLEIGHVYDVGDYQGSTLGGNQFQAVKIRRSSKTVIASITSFRPHGVFDGFGLEDAEIGPVYYKTEATSDDSSFATGVYFRLVSQEGDSTTACKNVHFQSITLDLPASTPSAILIYGTSATPHERVTIGHLSISLDTTNITGPVIELRNIDSCAISSSDLNLSGPVFTVLIRLRDFVSNTVAKLCNNGPAKITRVDPVSLSGSNNSFIIDGNKDDVFFGNDEALLAESNDIFLGASAYTFSGSFPRTASATSSDVSTQLPVRGTYIVTLAGRVAGPSVTHAIGGTWIVSWWEDAGTLVFKSVSQIGSDYSKGSTLTDISLAVSDAGLLTATFTAGTATQIEPQVHWARLGRYEYDV